MTRLVPNQIAVREDGALGMLVVPQPTYRRARRDDYLIGQDIWRLRVRNGAVYHEIDLVAVTNPYERLQPGGPYLVVNVAERYDYDQAHRTGTPLPSGEPVALEDVVVRDDLVTTQRDAVSTSA